MSQQDRPQPAPYSKVNPTSKLHRRIIKATSYSMASVLAVLMLTAALPPIVADQSDRAILDAPITLVTTPIAGEVTALNANVADTVAQGATIAEVTNARVDRSALIALESRANNYRQALAAAQSKKQSDLHYVDALDKEIAAQKAQLISHFEKQTAEFKANADAAQALVEEKRALRDRQANMVARDVASDYMLKPTTQQVYSAKSTQAAASQRLEASLAELDAIKHDIFVGDDLVGIATLVQKRRDISFDAERQAIDEAQAKEELAEETSLIEAERRRLQSLAHARLTSPNDGEVLNVGVALSRHIHAGDAVATLVDCRNLFAVAIFSYRQGTTLSVGTRVTISGAERPVGGIVEDIIPKSNDKSDALYAVPFPQTERREMYVVVKPDADIAPLRPASADGTQAPSCPVGKWVTVTRADGWVPSTSVIWHKASSLAMTALASVLASLHETVAPPRHAHTAGARDDDSR